MAKRKLSYFGLILRRQGSLEKTAMLGKAGGSMKRMNNYEMGSLYKRSHRQESTGAEQGC